MAVNWAKEFAQRSLEENMFSDLPGKKEIAATIVKHLTDFTGNRAHDRHIPMEECKNIGLNVKSLEVDYNAKMQDAVLSVHHANMHALANSPAFKIIENHPGRAYVKTQLIGMGMPVPVAMPQGG